MKNKLGLKIVALAVAVLIWVQVTLMADHQSKVNLRLKLEDVPESDSLLLKLDKVPCLVQGRGLDILKLRFSRASIAMAASDLASGELKSFQTQDLPLNLDLTILAIDPSFSRKLGDGSALDPDRLAGADKQNKARPTRQQALENSGAPIISQVLSNIPITDNADRRYFPSVVTLKLRGRAPLLENLPQGISVQVAENPDARGLYRLSVLTPEGVTLQDITPKQVRLASDE